MKYDELKRTEAGYLASNSKTFREYGKVLKYLKDRYDSYSQNCTSDEILFSDINVVVEGIFKRSKETQPRKAQLLIAFSFDDNFISLRFSQ